MPAESKPDSDDVGDGVVSSGRSSRLKRREMTAKQSPRKMPPADDADVKPAPEHKAENTISKPGPPQNRRTCCFPFLKFLADSFDYFGYGIFIHNTSYYLIITGYRYPASADRRLDRLAWERFTMATVRIIDYFLDSKIVQIII